MKNSSMTFAISSTAKNSTPAISCQQRRPERTGMRLVIAGTVNMTAREQQNRVLAGDDEELFDDLCYLFDLAEVTRAKDGTFTLRAPSDSGRTIFGVTSDRALKIIRARWGVPLYREHGTSRPTKETILKEDVVSLHLVVPSDVFACGLTEGELRDAGAKWADLKSTADPSVFVSSTERLCSVCARVLRSVPSPAAVTPRMARMDGPDGPVCACSKPSRHESGWCGESCGYDGT
jgi:hypothetical protein